MYPIALWESKDSGALNRGRINFCGQAATSPLGRICLSFFPSPCFFLLHFVLPEAYFLGLPPNYSASTVIPLWLSLKSIISALNLQLLDVKIF